MSGSHYCDHSIMSWMLCQDAVNCALLTLKLPPNSLVLSGSPISLVTEGPMAADLKRYLRLVRVMGRRRARRWIGGLLSALSFLLPISLLFAAGMRWFPRLLGRMDSTLLLAAASTNFMAVTEMAIRPELGRRRGKLRDSYLLTLELVFFGAAMGYALHKSDITPDLNMWLVFLITAIALLVSPLFSDAARLGMMSWAFALTLSLYLTSSFLSRIQRMVYGKWMSPALVGALRPHYPAYLHLLIIPLAYVFFDSFLTVPMARKSRGLDLALLLTGAVCAFLGWNAPRWESAPEPLSRVVRATNTFELGASVALLLFANSAYYLLLTQQECLARRNARKGPWSRLLLWMHGG